MEALPVYALLEQMMQRLDVCWTFMLLLSRYAIFFLAVPGIGGGPAGLVVRYPAVVALSLVSLDLNNIAPLPSNVVIMAGHFVSELVLGGVVGMIPILIVAGAQTAGHLASGTMGLNGAQMVDPTTSTSLSDLARIYSDISVIIFLMVGGHHVAIEQLAAFSHSVTPGTFMLSEGGLNLLIEHSARVFEMGCLMAAPVIVALLLTNFVLGIVSKAVPSVNVFMLSFPLTIGIGLTLSMLALPEMLYFLARQFTGLEGFFMALAR
jgi:flagellar biosynthetic protein FliR